MKYSKNKLFFYLILFKELIFLPYFYLYEFINKRVILKKIRLNKRIPVISNKVYIGIHEWGGYELTRSKQIKNIKPFTCGLYYQLERFKLMNNSIDKFVGVTLSDAFRYSQKDYLSSNSDAWFEVDNLGFDFSGYSYFHKEISKVDNAYVLLTNSSVNSSLDEFISGYIDYLENNLDVGILGISACSIMQQSLIRNNFRPHIQSFFLLTTIDVLNQIVKANKNKFPGDGIDHKLYLIREGEIKISELALNLGYSLAVVLESGKVFKFNKTDKTKTCFQQWKNLPKGDMRVYMKEPNKITPILTH